MIHCSVRVYLRAGALVCVLEREREERREEVSTTEGSPS